MFSDTASDVMPSLGEAVAIAVARGAASAPGTGGGAMAAAVRISASAVTRARRMVSGGMRARTIG